ncbi:Acyltransferase family protein [Tessaracoccus bendigoensis DSM 12906]|uniref:Acyltransferase family protein n=1 Tax=Tessaracoccus bendigoensis DSM 12906 TaxID=1123357 RepID=A0A1M6MN32_9ACTN|nr:Acyltransferase family protein [Tessaracoccus bendigoensis DSM 12906]
MRCSGPTGPDRVSAGKGNGPQTARIGRVPPTASYVPSLDGLRTIAVGLVIAFHLSVPRLGLGFAGVDVFFVLSGYLITSGLLRDTQLYGRPQFAKFWQRRFKRLLPAATLVLLGVLTYATFFIPLFRRTAASEDVAWTALYLANWHFMGSNSYFSSDGTPSLLLHMWSLAVEEQFYFIWPLLIGLIAWLLGRFGARNRLVATLASVTVAISLISAVALMALYDPEAPDRAYMGTDSKAFEPLLGALLAILMSVDGVRAWFSAHTRSTAAVGAAMAIVVLPFLEGPSRLYFQGGAVILSIGVALVIGSLATSSSTGISKVLSVAPMVYLGKISYGLYIWHWPWSVLLGLAHHDGFRALRAPVALVGTLICAVLSYHFVEEPIRRGRISKWLTGRRLLVAVAATMAVTLGWSTALRMSPAVAEGKTIVVVGDSVPFRLMESLDEAARAQQLVVDNASRGGCPPLSIELQEYGKPDHEGVGDCTMVAGIQEEKLKADQPDIVFWWSRYEIHQRWIDGRVVGPDEELFWTTQRSDTEATIDRLTSTGAILVIAQTERPGGGMLSRCTAEDCHPLYDLMINHDEHRRRWNDMVVDIAATDDRVRTFRMDPVVCNDAEPAEAVAPATCDDRQPGGRVLRPDGSHILVDPYGREVADEVLQEVLTAAG